MTIFIIVQVWRGISEKPFIFVGEERRHDAEEKFKEMSKKCNVQSDCLDLWHYHTKNDKAELINSLGWD